MIFKAALWIRNRVDYVNTRLRWEKIIEYFNKGVR